MSGQRLTPNASNNNNDNKKIIKITKQDLNKKTHSLP